MTRRDAFILGVSTYCKTAELDVDDTLAVVGLLMESPKAGTEIIKRARLDPKLQALVKEAWGWGGAGHGALSGAGWGASLGSFIPGVGTAIGAGVGGLAGGLLGGLFGGGGDDSDVAGQAAYDDIMGKFTDEQKQLYGPQIQQVAYEAKRKAVEGGLDPGQRKMLGMAPGGKNVASGSAAPDPERPHALQGEFLSGQTGLTDQQLAQATDRANQRMGAGRFYRRHLRQLGMSGRDIESMTPDQMREAGFSPANISVVQGAQKYRGQQRTLAGGRGFSQLGSGFGSPSGGPSAVPTPATEPTPAATPPPPAAGSPATAAAAETAPPPSSMFGPGGQFFAQRGNLGGPGASGAAGPGGTTGPTAAARTMSAPSSSPPTERELGYGGM